MGLFEKKDKKPEFIIVNGRKLECDICGHDMFLHREAQLNTATASLFNVDWANKTGHCYICDNCTKIQWFLEKL